MGNKLPTANEYIDNITDENGYDYFDYGDFEVKFAKAMTGFAKLYARHALEQAAEKAEIEWPDFYDAIIDKASILNAFDVEEIK